MHPRCLLAPLLLRGTAVASVLLLWPRCGHAVALLWPRCGLSGLTVALPSHRCGLAVPTLVVFFVCFLAEIKSTIRSDVMVQTCSALGGTQQPCDARGFSFVDCDPGPKLVPEGWISKGSTRMGTYAKFNMDRISLWPAWLHDGIRFVCEGGHPKAGGGNTFMPHTIDPKSIGK